MGLDIQVYSGLREIDKSQVTRDERGEIIEQPSNCVEVWANDSFPDRELPLKHKHIYQYQIYHDDIHIDMSYGRYNSWREELARLGGYPIRSEKPYFDDTAPSHSAGAWEQRSGPFFELILFSDCEGVIGGKVAAKLAADFAQYQEMVDSMNQPVFKDVYNMFRKAFEEAAHDGCVIFC